MNPMMLFGCVLILGEAIFTQQYNAGGMYLGKENDATDVEEADGFTEEPHFLNGLLTFFDSPMSRSVLRNPNKIYKYQLIDFEERTPRDSNMTYCILTEYMMTFDEKNRQSWNDTVKSCKMMFKPKFSNVELFAVCRIQVRNDDLPPRSRIWIEVLNGGAKVDEYMFDTSFGHWHEVFEIGFHRSMNLRPARIIDPAYRSIIEVEFVAEEPLDVAQSCVFYGMEHRNGVKSIEGGVNN